MAVTGEPKHVIGANRPESPGLSSAGEEKPNNTSDNQVDNTNTEDQKPVLVKGRKGWLLRLWEHGKRRWIFYTVGLIILLAILLPVFFLVIFPAIAQKMVNDATLPISSIGLSNPTPHSTDISLQASIKLPTPLSIHINPIPLSLFVNDGTKNIVPYTNVVLPENNLHGNTTLSFTDQHAEILDRDLFSEFVHSVVFSEEFTLSATGNTNAYVGKLKAPIHLQKDFKLTGLNSLAGFAIPDARLVLPPESDGTNLVANLSLPNASVLKIDLGNMTWNLIIGGVNLGKANIQNVILNPGSNIVPARCVLDLKMAIRHLRQIIASEKVALRKGNLSISASGNTTIYNSQHIDYYEKILSKLTLTAQVSLLSVIMDIKPNPKDSMKSTWRYGDRNEWTIHHWFYELLNIQPSIAGKEVPVHSKSDLVPYMPEWQMHRWVIIHAAIPLAIHHAYVSYTGHNLSPVAAFVFYTVAFKAIAIHQIQAVRQIGHQLGFFDGDKHERDGIPDVSVSKVFYSLVSTGTFRPLLAIFLSYQTSEVPASISWTWLPLEIGLYGIVLDFWFYIYHRLMHDVGSLWKYHRTHHLTKHPSPLLSLYADAEQEFFDIVGIPLLTYITLKFMGLPMGFYDSWVCHQYIVFTEIMGHSGLRMLASPPSTLTWLLRLFDANLILEDHDLHHRKGWKSSHNYGKQTRLWDRIFGTCHERIECLEGKIDYDNTAVFPFPWCP
ncbi:hypothetical protein V498_08939 [Pseudogymnoascus sp. VKM F-4517 (FW-2822)]|nr:hypothetical protein V498_08939 [Pseudogymnoascus sp. VKM F-4517 (FW-2822)]